MKKFFVGLSGIALLVCLAILGYAQPKGDMGGPMHKGDKGRCPMGHFKMMDADKDGKVSQKEWEEFHAKMFKNMDKNGDGFLSEDEMKPPMGEKMPPNKPKPQK
jgi:hypothetical protein